MAIGRRYVWGLFEHLRTPMAVKIIGEKGAEWDELKRIEIKPEWNIQAEGGNAELQADEVKKKRVQEIMATLAPDELMILSPRWRAETKLRTAGIEEDEIRMAFDTQNEGNREILSEASMAIQDILKGKQPKLNRGANTAYIQKLLDYATDTDLKQTQYEAMIAFAQAHIPIAQENMARKAVQLMAQKGIAPTTMGTPQPSAVDQLYGQPAANTPQGTQSQSQQLTPDLNVAGA